MEYDQLDDYRLYIHKSRYARYIDDKSRRENWDETVQRLIDFYNKKFPDHTDVLNNDIKNAILKMDVMPSMRSLMTAGPALERDNIAGFNCFAGSEQYMTESGLRSFADTVGTTQQVLAGDGTWREAQVHSFGEQQLFKVTLQPNSRFFNKVERTVEVTANHRWITTNRGEVTDLKIGDIIPFNSPVEPDFCNKDFDFKVISIEPSTVSTVYCVTEPVTSQFTLKGGILTGNCSYIAIDHIKAFSEALFILMNGTGLGFSVERQYISQLPLVAEEFHDSETVILVKDSKLGWATALHELISLLYQGRIPKWDLSKLRPAGARLKTFGGRSSGPGPLDELFRFCVTTFRKAAGRKLTSLEVHDFMCKIGAIVVVGGVRRCLPGDTLVQIGPNEWKRMSDMAVGDQIYLDGEYQNVVNFFDQGNQEVLKINLEDGGYLESTAAHRWLVMNNQTNEFEWVRTDELSDNYSMVDPNEYTK